MFLRSVILRLLCAALLCTAASLHAQEPLTRLADVVKLTSDEGERRVPVVVRAHNLTVARFSPRAAIQQDSVPIHTVYARMEDLPPPNAEVEITGVTRGGKLRGFEEVWLEVQSVRVLATGVIPVPINTTLDKIGASAHPDLFVEAEGTVVQMRNMGPDLHLVLASEHGFCRALYRGPGSAPLPVAWLHSRLRVRGLNSRPDNYGLTLFIYGDMNVTVLAPGPSDPFARREVQPAELLKSKLEGEAVRFTGTLLHRTGISQWLRAADGTPVLADHYLPWAADPSSPDRVTPVPPVPVMRPGDTVEAVGFPAAGHDGLFVRYCHLRVLNSDGTAAPRRAEVAAVSRGEHRHDLVTLTGRVANQGTVGLPQSRLFEGVRLSADGVEVEAFLESPGGNLLPKLSPDDLIEATGIIIGTGSGAPDRLMLRSAADIRSLGIAPEVLRTRQWRNLSIIGCGALLASSVIFMLRRRLVKERALAGEVRTLNATLEQRVNERTAELEQAREDLKAALQEEREVGELKSRFVSSVSHEFRTPLGVIMSATDIIARYRDRIPAERMEEHLTEIRHATRHMSGMMENVLLMGRADAGRLVLTLRECDLVELCHRLADETRSATSQTGPTVITSDPLPGPAKVDEVLLRHMFSNLLANAVKYSPPGAPVEIHLRADGPDAVISITDHGIGIPEEDARRLFQPFARAGNVGERPGTGLGLVIVKRCAELHGGSVSFTSGPRGSTFTLRIPCWGEQLRVEG